MNYTHASSELEDIYHNVWVSKKKQLFHSFMKLISYFSFADIV